MEAIGLSWRRCAGVVGLCAAAGIAGVANGQECEGWLTGMGTPGVDGSITCSVMWDPDGAGPQTPKLVVGGLFSVAGPIVAHNIAMYDVDTGAWSALGQGTNAGVLALTIAPDGALIVGGTFSRAGGVNASRVARWNGASWSVMGPGFNENVFALHTTPGGNIIAGGAFEQSGSTTVNRIARWDGAAWTALGTGISSPGGSAFVFALATLTNGDLVAGGEFTSAGGVVVANAARWDSSWHAMGSLNSNIRAFTFWDSDGAGPLPSRLVAGGDFTPNRVAIWTGATWSMLSGSFNGTVLAVGTRPNGDLIAAGAGTGYIVRRAPSNWQALGTGLNAPATTVANLPDGRLFAGGGFSRAGTTDVAGAATWDGAAWSWNGAGINGPVWSVAPTHDGGALVGGQFTTIGDGVPARTIARWNGSEWARLGVGGVTLPAIIQTVFERSGSGDVIASGNFTSIDGVSAWAIARWNGANWSAMGAGLKYGFSPGVATALFDLPSGNLLVAGGFDTAGGQPANHVAVWNGTTWSALGTGVNGGVTDMAMNAAGELFAVSPTVTDGAMFVQHWDGATWAPFGEGFASGASRSLQAIALRPDGTVVVGGRFDFAGGVPVTNIALWNGLHWAALGTGVNGKVLDMVALEDGSIVVAGEFTTAGGLPAARMARWDGVAWHAMGSLSDEYPNPPLRVTRLANGEVAAIGSIVTVDGRVSLGFARYSFTGTPDVVTDPVDTTVIVGNTLTLSATPRAGFDGVSVQWTRNGKPISNGSGGASPGGGLVSGAAGPLESPTDGTPAVLIVEQTRASDGGEYAAVFTNDCGEATSGAAVVIIDIGECATDINDDGTVNSTDVSDFINLWFADQAKGTLVADWNHDGVVNSTDVSDFINTWFEDTLAGCGG